MIKGQFYNGTESRGHRARIEVKDEMVSVHGDEGLLLGPVPLNDVDVTDRIANTPRHVRFADGSMFETSDNGAVDRLLTRSGAWIHQLESRLVYVVVATLVVTVLVFYAVRDGVPAIADAAANAVPPAAADKLGTKSMEILDSRILKPSQLSEQRKQALNDYFQRFISPSEGEPVEVIFRGGGYIGANALALPNGKIIFTDELVNLSENDQQLAAIFAHELGHVRLKHGIRQALRASALTIGIAVILGDVSSLSSMAVAIPVILTESGYSREFEREADGFAIERMQAWGIPGQQFASILALLDHDALCDGKPCDDEASVTGYLASHPATSDRIRRIQSAL